MPSGYLHGKSASGLRVITPGLLYNEHLRHNGHFSAIRISSPESNTAEDKADLCIVACGVGGQAFSGMCWCVV